MVDKRPEQVVFPFLPASKFHAGTEAQFKATLATHRSIDGLSEAVDQGSKSTADAIKHFASIFEKQPDNVAAATALAEPLGKIAAALDGIAGSAGMMARRDIAHDVGAAVALFAAGVDTTGDIVARTTPGRWLNDAGYQRLGDIIPRGRPTDKGRAEFVARLFGSRDKYPGLPTMLSEADLALFYDLVPSTLKAIEDSQLPTGSASA